MGERWSLTAARSAASPTLLLRWPSTAPPSRRAAGPRYLRFALQI